MRARTLNFLFVGLVIAAIAVTIGSALLLRIAVCMASMLVLSLLSVALTYISAKISFSSFSLTITHGQRVSTEMMLYYATFLPMGSLAYAVDNGRTLRFDAFPFVKYKKKYAIDAPHVGVYLYGSGTLYMTDVFNLFVFSKRFDFSGALVTVLPASFDTDRPENRSREAGSGEVRLSDDAEEPSGIRDWVDGDLLKRVHWKLSIKNYNPIDQSITPVVKTYEEATRPEILILPDLSMPDATAETVAALRDGILEGAYALSCRIVETGDTLRLVLQQNIVAEYVAAAREDLNGIALALARAEFQSFFNFEALAREAMRRIGTSSTVAFVTARLDERVAELLIRLKSFSGMNIFVMLVTDEETGRQSALSQARLEDADIPVMRHILRAKEAAQ
ncbi:MAG: DUF58 domain-containing protein [Clostridia bacterium]|nr:DUF58 domain-containing protein [Clostridia bacterium]